MRTPHHNHPGIQNVLIFFVWFCPSFTQIFFATAHRILQPTPLVLALRNQLISQVTEKDHQTLADNRQQDSVGKLENENEVPPDVKKDTETKHDWNVPGDSRRMAPQVSTEMY